MARLNKKQFAPALFDVAQDISSGIPVELLRTWTEGEQTTERAKEILGSTAVRGIIVSSDSAGLTRLTAERGLVEILALIDTPKRILHRMGRSIGGTAVSIWAADNTQMFYPEEIPANEVLSMLLTVQDTVKAECGVQIGLGAHVSTFYALGGGLYGDEADHIEHIAENVSKGGEILITDAFHSALTPSHAFSVETHPHGKGIFRVLDGPRKRVPITPEEELYPIPYSQEFHEKLCAVRTPNDALKLENTHKSEACVVLVEREREETGSTEERLLGDLTLGLVMANSGRELRGGVDAEVKVVGNLGIYAFSDPHNAVSFARAMKSKLLELGIASRTGIVSGTVLLFDLPGGGKDIAGAPVNLASKMAQDAGLFGKIYATLEVATGAKAPVLKTNSLAVGHTAIEIAEL